jgi:YegS/Rv2252/BmrU family lipid kinase
VKRLLVITNAEAGNSDDDALDDALRVLQTSFEVEVAATDGVDELRAVLSRRGDRDVVVAGGDGSLHAVVNALHSSAELDGPAVGLIPLGTGNDFARSMDIPLDPAEAARVLIADRRRRIDVLLDADDTVVVNAVHAGIGADAGRAAGPWKRLGKVGYVAGALIAGLTTPGTRIKVVADDEVLADGRHRVLQVGVGNGSFIGGGVELTPDADPTDGLADVLVSFSVGPLTRLLYGLRLRRGTQEERHDVHLSRAASVTLSGAEFWCNADGELSGPFTERTWTVRRAALTLIAPSETWQPKPQDAPPAS